MHAPNILLTGFDAFGGESINPSWLAVQALHGRQIAGHRVVAAQLPTVFGESTRRLKALLKQHRPALVICVGQAGGRSALSLERVAVNVDDAPLADNAGAQPVDTPVVAEVSQTAGTFVCNHVFFGLMHALATSRPLRHTRGGFVHVPYLPEQGAPCMAREEMVRGLRLAVRCALLTPVDSRLGAGTSH
jgi:pyroglutamyl-peptidase